MTPDLSAFGDLRLVRPLFGGHRNAVWLVDTAKGPAVAKSTRHGPAALAWLAPVQAVARTAGLIVPAFHPTGDGAIVSNGFTVEDYCEGPGFCARNMHKLAARLAAFRANMPALPQRPGMRSLPEWLGVPMPFLPPDIAILCRAALLPFADHPVCPIHGDITPSNLILTANGPALIDWDEARCDLGFLDHVAISPPSLDEQRAHMAAEVINGWMVEPSYAQRCADALARA